MKLVWNYGVGLNNGVGLELWNWFGVMELNWKYEVGLELWSWIGNMELVWNYVVGLEL